MALIVCHKLLQRIDGEDDAGSFSNMKKVIRDCRTISKAGDVAKSHSPFVVAVPADQLIKVVARTGMFRSIHDDHGSEGYNVRILVFAGSDFRLRVKATNNIVSVSDPGYRFSKSLKSFTEGLDPSDSQTSMTLVLTTVAYAEIDFEHLTPYSIGSGRLQAGDTAVVLDSQPPGLAADLIDLSKGSSPDNAIIID